MFALERKDTHLTEKAFVCVCVCVCRRTVVSWLLTCLLQTQCTVQLLYLPSLTGDTSVASLQLHVVYRMRFVPLTLQSPKAIIVPHQIM